MSTLTLLNLLACYSYPIDAPEYQGELETPEDRATHASEAHAILSIFDPEADPSEACSDCDQYIYFESGKSGSGGIDAFTIPALPLAEESGAYNLIPGTEIVFPSHNIYRNNQGDLAYAALNLTVVSAVDGTDDFIPILPTEKIEDMSDNPVSPFLAHVGFAFDNGYGTFSCSGITYVNGLSMDYERTNSGMICLGYPLNQGGNQIEGFEHVSLASDLSWMSAEELIALEDVNSDLKNNSLDCDSAKGQEFAERVSFCVDFAIGEPQPSDF